MKKRYLLVVAAVAMAILFSGCGNRSQAGGGEQKTASGEKVKLTALFTKHVLTRDFSEFKWLKEIEDAAGVEVEWQQISADWGTKKAALLASGDVPDLFLGRSVVDADFAMYQGLFVDLAPLIEKYAPNIQRMFRERPETLALSKQPDGAIYGTAGYQRFWPKTHTTMYINKVWLDNLGLSVPATWDELYNVLIAFRDGDANGNGDKTDEIPMDFFGQDSFSPLQFLGSTGLQSTNLGNYASGYFVENGVVKNFWMDTRYREVMKFVHRLYAANLINPEALTHDYSTYNAVSRGQGKTARVGFNWGWLASSRFGLELEDQYLALPPFKMSADSPIDPRWQYDFYYLNMYNNKVSMTTRCKNQEVAMKFIDAFYLPENSLQVLFGGITDGNIAKNADGSYAILPPQDPSMDPGTWKWSTAFADNGPIFLADDMKVTLGADMAKAAEEKSLYDHAFTLIDPKKDILVMDFLKFTTGDNNTLEMNRVNFRNIADMKWAKWITEGGVEAEWDQYVKDLVNSGIEENNKIIQKYYDEFVKTL